MIAICNFTARIRRVDHPIDSCLEMPRSVSQSRWPYRLSVAVSTGRFALDVCRRSGALDRSLVAARRGVSLLEARVRSGLADARLVKASGWSRTRPSLRSVISGIASWYSRR